MGLAAQGGGANVYSRVDAGFDTMLMDSRSRVSMRAMPLVRRCFARQNHQTDYRYPHTCSRAATDFKILGKGDCDVDGTSQMHLRREAGKLYLESNLMTVLSSPIPRKMSLKDENFDGDGQPSA